MLRNRLAALEQKSWKLITNMKRDLMMSDMNYISNGVERNKH